MKTLITILKKIFKKKKFIVAIGDIIWDSYNEQYVMVMSYSEYSGFKLSNYEYCDINGCCLGKRDQQRYFSNKDCEKIYSPIMNSDIIEFDYDGNHYIGYYEKYKSLVYNNITRITINNVIKRNLYE